MFALREPFVLGEAAKVEASGAIAFSPTPGRNPALLPPRSPSLLALALARSQAVPMPLGVLSPRARFGDSGVPWAWLPTCTTCGLVSLRPVQGAQMSSALCRGSAEPGSSQSLESGAGGAEPGSGARRPTAPSRPGSSGPAGCTGQEIDPCSTPKKWGWCRRGTGGVPQVGRPKPSPKCARGRGEGVAADPPPLSSAPRCVHREMQIR